MRSVHSHFSWLFFLCLYIMEGLCLPTVRGCRHEIQVGSDPSDMFLAILAVGELCMRPALMDSTSKESR
jgi:hypothetical protein